MTTSPTKSFRVFLDVLALLALMLCALTLFISLLKLRGSLDPALTLKEKLLEYLNEGANRHYLWLAALCTLNLLASVGGSRLPALGHLFAALPLGYLLLEYAEFEAWPDYPILLLALLAANLLGRTALLAVNDRLVPGKPWKLAVAYALPALLATVLALAIPLAASRCADGALLDSTVEKLFPVGLNALMTLAEASGARFYYYLAGFSLLSALFLLWTNRRPLPGFLASLLPLAYVLRALASDRLSVAGYAFLLLAALTSLCELILWERAHSTRQK
jgi:hypothetical protein